MFSKKIRTKATEDDTPKISVGLDIGTTKIVAVAGQKGATGKAQILGYGEYVSLGVQRGQVINILKTTTAINHAIEQAKQSSSVLIDTVLAGIAGQHINSSHMQGEIKRRDVDTEVSQEDVKELIDSMFKIQVKPGTQIIDVVPQEYFVDSYRNLEDPVGVPGIQLGSIFNVITGNTQHIRNIIKCVTQCGLNMEGLILEPIASSEVVLDATEKESGVALVDIGGGTTDIAIFYNGLLRHTAVIPMGGDVITDDIKSVFNIIKREAEAIKIKYGSCIPDTSRPDHIITISGIKGREATEIKQKYLSEVIAARMNDIGNRIVEEIKNSGYAGRLGCGIVLTGGGSLMRNIKEFMKSKTDYDIKIGTPEEKIENIADSPLNNPVYSTALGLMVLGIERENTYLVESENIGTQKDSEEKRTRPHISSSWGNAWVKLKDILDTVLEGADDEDDDDFK